MGEATPDGERELNLKQVAARLGVHYMTAYRYVRAGRLPARRQGTVWTVRAGDVAAFAAGAAPAPRPAPRSGGPTRVDWVARLGDRLVAGDEGGAWSVVEAALASGWGPEDVLLDMVEPAVAGSDSAGLAGPRLATATAMRTSAVLTARFRRPGRRRGRVLLGAPTGESHLLATTLLADLLRLRGLVVLELGGDVPADVFAEVVAAARPPEGAGLVAVGISVTTTARLAVAAEVVAAVRSVDAGVPVMVGGQAVRNAEVSAITGATAWAADGRGVLAYVESLLPAARRRQVPAPR